MYINSEQDLEDYICSNIDGFIKFLKEIYGEDDEITFVSRQVNIAGYRMDLLFEMQADVNEPKDYIVVELKHRIAEPKDIAQISRYINLLDDIKHKRESNLSIGEVYGVLLATGLNDDVQEIQMLTKYSSQITYAEIKTEIEYMISSYSRRKEFIENMTYDNRLGGRENGKEKNDRP